MQTIRCAWCGLLIQQGDDNAPVSHGICPECAKTMREEMHHVPID